MAFTWRAGELNLGIHKIYDKKEYPLPYSSRDLEWIERLIIVLRIYQHFDFNKYAKPSKFLSPQQADEVFRNFAPSGQVLLKRGTHVASHWVFLLNK